MGRADTYGAFDELVIENEIQELVLWVKETEIDYERDVLVSRNTGLDLIDRDTGYTLLSRRF